MDELEDQSAVLNFLADPATHGGEPVERIDTHSAVVFLAGDRAIKLKRAVRYPFLDFSTVERRARFCRHEVELNRRTAPSIYRAALPVTREPDGRLALDGTGATVDWVVAMNRFDSDGLFDRRARAGRLDPATMTDLADAIAAFHAAAARTPDRGGAGVMQWVVDDNIAELRAFPDLFDGDVVASLASRSGESLSAVAPLLDRRREDGFVRHCHGDLHLGNICVVDGRPTLFDCIEFNDDLACVDTLYDLAYLLMDLVHCGRRDYANLVLNRYVARTADTGGLAALPLFLSARAAIRAKVEAIALHGGAAPDRRAELAEDARRFLALAVATLDEVPPRLIAIGGAPGTGKSTLGRHVAPAIGGGCGALQLRTDVLRKQMLGVDILQRLPESAYDCPTTERTYDRVVQEARLALSAGCSVVADATFTEPAFRHRIQALAQETQTPFLGLWLEAPVAVREDRVARRAGDASDATVELIRRHPERPEAPDGWTRLDAGLGIEALASTALGVVAGKPPHRAGSERPVPLCEDVRVNRSNGKGNIMPIKMILVPLTGLDADRSALDAAARLARRWNAHVDALHIRADGNTALPFLGETASGAVIADIVSRIEKDAADRARKAREQFGRWREASGLPERQSPGGEEPGCTFVDASGGRDALLAGYSRCADITIFNSAAAADSAAAAADIETALMSSGRPLLLVPAAVPENFGSRAVVAWNDSAESARAVSAAMPLLRAADAVTVVSVRENGNGAAELSGIERHLAGHGIAATCEAVDPGGRSIGEVLTDRTRRHDGAILVMGAYTHSRFREQVFGGVTRDILDLAEIPVLMIH